MFFVPVCSTGGFIIGILGAILFALIAHPYAILDFFIARRIKRATRAAKRTLRRLRGEKELLEFDCVAYQAELARRFRLREGAAGNALKSSGFIAQKQKLLLRKYPESPWEMECFLEKPRYLAEKEREAELRRRAEEFKISERDANWAYFFPPKD